MALTNNKKTYKSRNLTGKGKCIVKVVDRSAINLCLCPQMTNKTVQI